MIQLLEQCVKSCGPSFHSEIGKFRFLNELIKLVSPKYQAHRTPIHVKQRILEIIYSWTIDLKSEPKIHEAYDMLKKQGVIKENPNYNGSNNVQPISSAPREKIPFCDNSEKDALLQKLLKSKDPEDLQAANRLIKSMVREVSTLFIHIYNFVANSSISIYLEGRKSNRGCKSTTTRNRNG